MQLQQQAGIFARAAGRSGCRIHLLLILPLFLRPIRPSGFDRQLMFAYRHGSVWLYETVAGGSIGIRPQSESFAEFRVFELSLPHSPCESFRSAVRPPGAGIA